MNVLDYLFWEKEEYDINPGHKKALNRVTSSFLNKQTSSQLLIQGKELEEEDVLVSHHCGFYILEQISSYPFDLF